MMTMILKLGQDTYDSIVLLLFQQQFLQYIQTTQDPHN